MDADVEAKGRAWFGGEPATEPIAGTPARLLIADGSPGEGLVSALSVGLAAVDNQTIFRETGGELRIELLGVARTPWRASVVAGLAALVSRQLAEPGTPLTPNHLVAGVFGGDGVTTPHAVLLEPFSYPDYLVRDGDDVTAVLQVVPLSQPEYDVALARGPQSVLQRIVDADAIDLLDLGRASTQSEEEAAAATASAGYGVQTADDRGEQLVTETVVELFGDKGQLVTYEATDGAGASLEPHAIAASGFPNDGMMMAFTASMNRVDTGETTEGGKLARREAVVHVRDEWTPAVLQGLGSILRRLAHGEAVPDTEELVMGVFPREVDGRAVTCNHALVVAPQFYEFPPLELPDRDISIVQLVPITDAECQLALGRGVLALMQQLAQSKAVIVDLGRPSSV